MSELPKADSGRIRTVIGSGEVHLHVREFGNPDGLPILLLHGYAQTSWCWARQMRSEALQDLHLIMPDLRGHGRSGKPADPAAYSESEFWADDIAAVIDAMCRRPPMVVAWSFSGLILCDYLRHYGDSGLAGINLVSARTMVGTPRARRMSGDLFLELVPGFCATDAEARIEAVSRFLGSLTAEDIADPDFYTMLGYNLATPPHVCAALLDRSQENDDVLAGITVPTLISHGDGDTSVLLAMAEHHAEVVPGADLSVYAGVGHAPFWERSSRFNEELAAFASKYGKT